MSTNSTIAVVHADGTVSQIYCHWDSYIEHNGKILVEHYTTLEKVEAMIALGDMSSLAEEIGTKHDFDKAPKGQCNYYGRDRGEEEDSTPTTFWNLEMYALSADRREYNYLFLNGQWVLTDRRAGATVHNPVKELLAEL